MSTEELPVYPSPAMPRVADGLHPFGWLQKLVGDVVQRYSRAELDTIRVHNLADLVITRTVEIPRDVMLLREARKTVADLHALLALGKPIDQLMMVRLSEAQRVIADTADKLLPKG